jgi:hypothetical protein
MKRECRLFPTQAQWERITSEPQPSEGAVEAASADRRHKMGGIVLEIAREDWSEWREAA